MARAVQEVWVAEGDVRRPRLDLLADVREHDVPRHDEEAPAVDGRDRAVPAEMLAAAGRLDGARELEPAVLVEVRVLLQRRELKKYAHLDKDGRLELAGYVEATRGCKHLCRHCPIPPVYGGRFFVVPRHVVLADIRQQVEAGAAHITFGDPDFLNGPGHALAVARALHAELPSVTFDFTAKVEHLRRHRARLREFADLGCAFIVTAAESVSDTVLAHLAKGHTRADLIEALRAVRAAGTALRPTWVPFTPWATLDDYRELLDFVEAHELIDAIDPVQYSIRLLVPPGSLLLESGAMRPFLGPLVQDAFYYRWIHPDPRMERLAGDVAALVAQAAEAREDTVTTFNRIRHLADAAAGARPRADLTLPPGRTRPPRLTEPWFC